MDGPAQVADLSVAKQETAAFLLGTFTRLALALGAPERSLAEAAVGQELRRVIAEQAARYRLDGVVRLFEDYSKAVAGSEGHAHAVPPDAAVPRPEVNGAGERGESGLRTEGGPQSTEPRDDQPGDSTASPAKPPPLTCEWRDCRSLVAQAMPGYRPGEELYLCPQHARARFRELLPRTSALLPPGDAAPKCEWDDCTAPATHRLKPHYRCAQHAPLTCGHYEPLPAAAVRVLHRGEPMVLESIGPRVGHFEGRCRACGSVDVTIEMIERPLERPVHMTTAGEIG